MKKYIAILLAIAMLVSLAGCSGGEKPETDTSTVPAAQASGSPLMQTAQYLLDQVPNPAYGSVGGEWLALGIARSELEGMEDFLFYYGEQVSEHIAEKGGVLHAKKYTEYSRVILAWTALGRDASDVAGFDLLVPLADFEQTVFQGINGAIFALLALDSGNYEVPENLADSTQASRELYVDHLLRAQLEDGGWALAGTGAEIDMTAMALQALAKYRDWQDVDKAVEKGLELLSRQQSGDGGFSSQGESTSESVSQAIVALTELGISIEDPRFVKNGNTLVDGLMQYSTGDGGFSHVSGTGADLLATEQAFYALVALERMEQGKTSLYRMK